MELSICFVGVWYPIVWPYCKLFIHSTVGGHLSPNFGYYVDKNTLTHVSKCTEANIFVAICCCYSVTKWCMTLCYPHGLQHARLPCPSLSPGVCSNSCPLSWWCHPTILSSVTPFSSCLQSFPASGSSPVSQLFASGGQSIGVSDSASVFQVNTQDWSLGWTGWISLRSQGLSRVF